MISDFQTLIFKLYTDKELRASFSNNPEKIFETYNLTSEEKTALAKIPRERLEIFAANLSKKRARLAKKTITINFRTLISAGSLKFLWIVLKNDLFGKKITYL